MRDNIIKREKDRSGRQRLFWILCLAVLWSGAAFLLLRANGDLSLNSLLSFQPQNPWLAALVMCGLFALKSVDVLLHCSVLFAMSGIMYPLPAALALNLVGVCILAAVPYRIGRGMGTQALEQLRSRYPKLRMSEETDGLSAFTGTLLLRGIGLPIMVVGLFLGAKRTPFRPYLAASVLGLSALMIPYTVIGDQALTIGLRSMLPMAVGLHLLMLSAAVVLYRIVRKRAKNNSGVSL